MFLLVGLGNPGPKYEANRHNVGFMAVDQIASRYRFPVWRKKFNAELSEGAIGGVDARVVLLKPQAFMNKSGDAVQAARQFYKIPLDRTFVFHDELDVAPGKLKIKQGGGAGGHNGLRSMDAQGGADYWRVRIGIGHPGVHAPNKEDLVTRYVLSDFAKADQAWLAPLLDGMADNLPRLLNKGGSDFLTGLNLKPVP